LLFKALQVGGEIFMINHFEYPQPAAVYLSKLTADSNGDLSMIDTAHVPYNSSRVQGLWFLCRGEKTPWGTHLGAEEYPPDCEL
jgi:secreted PhoX family phosphatase